MSDPMNKVSEIAGQVIGKVNEFAESEQVKGAVDAAKGKIDEIANNEQVKGAVSSARETRRGGRQRTRAGRAQHRQGEVRRDRRQAGRVVAQAVKQRRNAL